MIHVLKLNKKNINFIIILKDILHLVYITKISNYQSDFYIEITNGILNILEIIFVYILFFSHYAFNGLIK